VSIPPEARSLHPLPSPLAAVWPRVLLGTCSAATHPLIGFIKKCLRMSESWASGTGGGGGGTVPWIGWREGHTIGRQSSGCDKLHISPSIAAMVPWVSPLAGTEEREKLQFAECKVKCRLQAGTLVGWGGRGELEMGLGRLEVPYPPPSPPSIPWPRCLPSNGLERGGVDFVHQKAAAPGLPYPAVFPCPCPRGGPRKLVVPKDGAVAAARAVHGGYFCRFVKNKTKAGLTIDLEEGGSGAQFPECLLARLGVPACVSYACQNRAPKEGRVGKPRMEAGKRPRCTAASLREPPQG